MNIPAVQLANTAFIRLTLSPSLGRTVWHMRLGYGLKGIASLVPRLLEGGEKRAWYTLFMHTLYHPDFPGIGILSVHVRVQ